MEKLFFEGSEEGDKTRKRKISPESDEVFEHYTVMQNMDRVFYKSFLERDLDSLLRIRKIIDKQNNNEIPAFVKESPGYREYTEKDYDKEVSEFYSRSKDTFFYFLQYSESSLHARRILLEALEKKTVLFPQGELETIIEKVRPSLSGLIKSKKDFQKMFGGDGYFIEDHFIDLNHLHLENAEEYVIEKEDIECLIWALHYDKLPENIWIAILKNNAEQINYENFEFQKNLKPIFDNRFLSAISKLSSDKTLPISMERIETVLSTSNFIINDGLAFNGRDLISGYYDSLSNTVSLSLPSGFFSDKRSEKSIDEIYKTYVHEVLHAISGKTILSIFSTAMMTYTDMIPIRIGLSPGGRFRWLDEAMTECLTSKITAYDPLLGPYKNEVKILELIMKKGHLTLEDFYPTYFKHYDPGNINGENDPASEWKILNLKISERLGTKFLLDLDKRIQNHGVNSIRMSLEMERKREIYGQENWRAEWD